MYIDRTGLTPGRLWANDVGDVFEVADSRTGHIVYRHLVPLSSEFIAQINAGCGR